MRKKIRFGCIALILSICLLFAGPLFNLFSTTVAFADSNIVPTLHEETKIYRVNESAFEGAARETQYANQTAKITVLTHGYDSSPLHFSNAIIDEGKETEKVIFAYNEHSIISALSQKLYANGGINLYYAKGITIENADGTVEYDAELYKLSDDDYEPTSAKLIDMLDDVSKHIVLFYEASIPDDGHEKVYGEFDTVLDTVSAQYKALTGLLPIYNLIGHSRGGITNLMFATNHPYNVDKVISVGTPYHGSRLGMIDEILYFSKVIRRGQAKPQGVLDILSEPTAINLRNAWNSVYAQGVRANVISIGTMMDISAIPVILQDDSVSGYVGADIVSILQTVIEKADEVPGLVEFTLDFIDGLASVLQFFGVNTLQDLNINLYDWDDVDIEIYRKILELVKNINGNLVIADDLFIDTDSQLGQGFDDGVSYIGFSRMVKVLTAEDIAGECSNPTLPPIGHNLETMNPDIVSFISNSLVCGFANDNILQISEEFQGTYTDVQAFRIQPQYSGLREFSISNGTLSMYKYTDCGLKYCEVSGIDISNSGTFTYNLKNDEVYLLVVKPSYLSTAQFAFRHANTIVLGNNQIKYEYDSEQSFKLVFEDNYFYNLSCGIEGAYFNVYDSNWVLLQSGQNEVSIETGEGEILFVNLFLPNVFNDYVDVECVKERKVEFIDDKFGKVVEPMSFINDVGGNFEILSENGYIFNGWTGANEEIVLASDIADINQATVVLHSSWRAIPYQIIYEENGGEVIPNGVYSLDEGCELPTVEEMSYDGYVFVGWYENANYSGEPIAWVGDRIGEVTLYARWAQEVYILNNFSANVSSIDNQNYTTSEGVSVENFAVSVTYGEYFELPTLSSTCFGFQGWYYGDERITDEQGHSYMPYTYIGIMPLEARWYRNAIKFRLTELNQFEICLITDGLAEAILEIPYIQNLSPNDIIAQLRISTDAEVYDAIFSYLYRDGYKYECLTVDEEGTEIAGGQVIEYLDEGNEILLYPQYEREEYTIYFHFLGTYDEQVVYYGDAITYPLDTNSITMFYTVDGWYNNANNVRFNENSWPDLTPNNENNGSLSLKLEGSYKNFEIDWKIPDFTYDGKPIDSTLYDLDVVMTSYNYLMTIDSGTFDSVAYELLGWYGSSNFEESTLLDESATGYYGTKIFYAKLIMKQYTVTYNPNGGALEGTAIQTVDYGTTITLLCANKSGHKGNWGDDWRMDGKLPVSNFGDEFVVVEDEIFVANWKQVGTIEYENRFFMDKEAEILWDNWLYVEAPNYYFYGYEFELNRASAYIQSDGPYSPQLRFLGWYTSETFETPINSIPENKRGTVTVYAKWRYDQDNPSRWGTYYIDDSDPLSQDYDRLYLGLTTNDLAGALDGLKIDTLVIKFWIEIKGTGTASIHLYNGNTILQTRTIADSKFSDDKFYVCECTFAIELSEIKDLSYIDIRYQASTSGWWIFSSSDNWQTESIYYEKFYVADENDANSPELYWHYQFPYEE